MFSGGIAVPGVAVSTTGEGVSVKVGGTEVGVRVGTAGSNVCVGISIGVVEVALASAVVGAGKFLNVEQPARLRKAIKMESTE